MIRIALTHDIDRTKKTYQFLTKPLLALRKGNMDNFKATLRTWFKNKNYWNFDDIIDIETRYGVKSTFFFLNESIPLNWMKLKSYQLSLGRYDILQEDIVELIRWLDKNNWEIGVHGSYRSYKDSELLKNEKNILEEIVGHEIFGIRQHYLNLNDDTWDIQAKLGFHYDSSFGFTRSIGFKEDKIAPFQPFNDEFYVFPQVIMDTPYLMTPNRKYELEKILDECEKHDGILVVNFHNDKFNINDFPGYRDAYIEIIEAGMERSAVFNTLANFYDQHLSNNQKI